MFLSIAEEQCGPNTRVGLMFLPKGQEKLQVADPFVFENVDIEEAPMARYGSLVERLVRAITTPRWEIQGQWRFYRCEFGWNPRS